MIEIRTIYFLAFLAAFVTILLGVGLYYYLQARKRRKYPYGKFEDLLRRLMSVDRDNVALIALDLIDESGNQRSPDDTSGPELDPSDIWDLIGGLKGLEVLERNCEVLVDLVFYVQQWYPEALALTEELRKNAREIQWHLSRLRSAAKIGSLERSFPDYAQRAIATYYLMTRRVLSVYEGLNLPGVAELQRAL
ncbi:hypothetical protein [Edaphobacter dinghuensis]|uniref:Uncharacterized protein n=1 Tax=Edaphobacter dinghuensis TaxID=1560005 RepID=A0A917MB42_9BACT|nr:hypothetical protein [Edaphobacter dinghuensis]GGG86479.1 hypothetical protein GCM10011585_33030 [Edaphobacter dinghuensis]